MLAQIVTLREIVAMWKSSARLCGIFTVFLSACVGTVNADERERFLAAEQALAVGKLATFQQLAKQLKDYPLYPYLVFAELRKSLDKADARRVKRFLDDYAETPLAGLMRTAWLDELARQKRWSEYLAFYRTTDNTRLHCYQLQALLQTGQAHTVWPQVEAVWLHGHSRPTACDPILKAWRAASKLTDDLVWRRFALAMSANQTKLATYLTRYLGKQDQIWAERWQQLHTRPLNALHRQDFAADHAYREAMLAHAVRRLADWDTQAAIDLWKKLQTRYTFDPDQRYDTDRFIALNLTREEDVRGYRFLQGLAPRAEDKRLHETRLRAALHRSDWRQVLEWIDELPPALANSERWQYWRARALAKTGEENAAEELFAKVAEQRSFYGFLAADRVDADYHLAHSDTPIDGAAIAQIAVLPGARRARELHALQRWIDARREWRDLTKRLNKVELKAAAELAESWNWHDQAIFTLARTGYWDDLVLRFPVRHTTTVHSNAKRHQLDPAWVFAVVRQESAFMRDAVSRAGARGLMQLMPRTARVVARKAYGKKPPQRKELFDAETNISLGTAYLRQVLDELGDNTVLATAAYNAGPHRVKRWLPQDEQAADLWVELVPFRETRGYLRRVLAYTVIYEHRLGREPTRLSHRLAPISGEITLSKKRSTPTTG
jgi:soluble lytic murein transglycosylase